LFGSKVVDRGLLELFGAYGINQQLNTYPALYNYSSSVLPALPSQLETVDDERSPEHVSLGGITSRYLFGPNMPDYALYTGLFAILVILFMVVSLQTDVSASLTNLDVPHT
jgi:hypothetical protein